jgi:hypothetical protein
MGDTKIKTYHGYEDSAMIRFILDGKTYKANNEYS